MKIVTVVSSLAVLNVLATMHATQVDQNAPAPHTSSRYTPALVSANELQSASPAAQRFDHRVRADFFAGLRGDESALARAMKTCEDTLASDPTHAEAMVWHGSGLLFRAGQAFARGDAAKGMKQWEHGLREMDDAVALAPESVGVLIPRAATLLEVSRSVPTEDATALLAKALADYEKVLALQQPVFATLSAHAKGELLFGLAEGWARKGDLAKARQYFEQILSDAPGSGQQVRARAWIETGELPAQTGCIGCH